MSITVTERSYPEDEPLTPKQYAQGLRDPYWFAEYVLSDEEAQEYRLAQPDKLYKHHPFYQWCAERDIRVEVSDTRRDTYIYAYIQDQQQALEAKMWFG